MGDLASSCKDKLAYFRIKELKDALTQLRLPKQGKKQELIDRVLALLSNEQGQGHHGWGKRNPFNNEEVAKIVDDIYKKMQVHGAPELASRSHSGSDFNHIGPKEEVDDFCQLEKVRCLCGSSFLSENMIKCEDCQCQVRQHMSCVLIPEKPMEGVAPEVPSNFYCELCRLSRADPFWVTSENPLPPVRFMSSRVANDGTNLPQSVEKTFHLSRAGRETVQKAEYDLQVWCMLLNDKVQFRMHWPNYAELQVNGIPVRVVTRPGSQLLGINGRDDGPLITSCCCEGINKICFSRADARTFCFGIRIARRRTVAEVLNLVPKEADGELFEDALARVCRCLKGGNTAENTDSDSDVEVVADFFPVSLRCPNSGSRIKIAGRFKPCCHMGCFDMETFVELNQRSRKWQCPICLKNYSLENMVIDPYFNRITSLLRHSNEDVNEIDVKPNGSWRVKGDVENRELVQWHMPDGTLCNLKEDTKPVVDNLNQFNKEGNYVGQRSLNIGMKKNPNGIWEVSSKADDKKPSVVLDDMENDVEYHIPNVVLMSSSPTWSCKDGEDASVNQEGNMQFDLSLNNGHEFDSLPLNFGQTYNIEDRPQQQFKDADLIVLSDSDEENIVMVSPPAAYDDTTATVGGFCFASNTVGFTERYQEDAGVGASALGLFNNSDDFDINPWPMQSCTQPEQGFQFFGTDTDAANALVDSHHSYGMTPNDYRLDCNAGRGGTSIAQDLSTCHTSTEMHGSLVDNQVAFGSDDPSLQIFLPSRPSGVPAQAELTEHANIPNGLQSDDWISLTLAAGGGGNEGSAPKDAPNSQPQIPMKGTRMEPLSDAAASLLSLNGGKHNMMNSNPRIENIFSPPRQPRSVRPRLCLSMDTDSE